MFNIISDYENIHSFFDIDLSGIDNFKKSNILDLNNYKDLKKFVTNLIISSVTNLNISSVNNSN